MHKGETIIDGVPIYGMYDGVEVGVIYTNGKPATIFLILFNHRRKEFVLNEKVTDLICEGMLLDINDPSIVDIWDELTHLLSVEFRKYY